VRVESEGVRDERRAVRSVMSEDCGLWVSFDIFERVNGKDNHML